VESSQDIKKVKIRKVASFYRAFRGTQMEIDYHNSYDCCMVWDMLHIFGRYYEVCPEAVESKTYFY